MGLMEAFDKVFPEKGRISLTLDLIKYRIIDPAGDYEVGEYGIAVLINGGTIMDIESGRQFEIDQDTEFHYLTEDQTTSRFTSVAHKGFFRAQLSATGQNLDARQALQDLVDTANGKSYRDSALSGRFNYGARTVNITEHSKT